MIKIIKKLYCERIDRLKSDKYRLALYLLYAAFVISVSVYSFSVGMVRNGFLPLAHAAFFLTALAVAESYLSMRCGKLFLIIVFLVPIGGTLGTCLDLYNVIPFLDTLLHTISGFIFCAFGYALMERILVSCGRGSRLASAVFAVAFSLALAVVWELFEWGITMVTKGDMLEDSIVTEIHSYFLSGSHNLSVDIPNIEQTLIIYDGGKTYVIEGGYLDLGGLDTLVDMLVCFLGAVAFGVLCIVDGIKKTEIVKHITPRCATKKL